MSALGKCKLSVLILIAFFSITAVAQDLPGIAVYVTGDITDNKRRMLSTRMHAAFIDNGRYRGIERHNSFFTDVENEYAKQGGAELSDRQIIAFGKQFGARYVCIVDVNPAAAGYKLSVRIIDSETAKIVNTGETFNPLHTMGDLDRVSREIVNTMFKGQTAPQPQPIALEPRPAESISQPMAEPKSAKSSIKPMFWVGLGLDVVGVGIITYGIIENGRVNNLIDDNNYPASVKAEKRRNAAYIIGACVLLSGISVHIFF